jgi:hypothetical protein
MNREKKENIKIISWFHFPNFLIILVSTKEFFTGLVFLIRMIIYFMDLNMFKVN